MLRLAIIETEEVAKELLFEFMRQLPNREWEFAYFTKISEFAKEDEKRDFQIVVFHEKFDVPRITQSFVLAKPSRIVIYTEAEIKPIMKERHPYQRILYVDKHHIKEQMIEIIPFIDNLLKREEIYLFHYNNISVPLKISDIIYVEKEDKYLIYHTNRGKFQERKNMKDIAGFFEPYDFIWIHSSYLVNMQFITRIESDQVYLKKLILPIARSRKNKVIEKMHQIVSN